MALLKKLTGSGEFCSDSCRHNYQEEFNKLALERLLDAKTRSSQPPAGPLRAKPAVVAKAAEPVIRIPERPADFLPLPQHAIPLDWRSNSPLEPVFRNRSAVLPTNGTIALLEAPEPVKAEEVPPPQAGLVPCVWVIPPVDVKMVAPIPAAFGVEEFQEGGGGHQRTDRDIPSLTSLQLRSTRVTGLLQARKAAGLPGPSPVAGIPGKRLGAECEPVPADVPVFKPAAEAKQQSAETGVRAMPAAHVIETFAIVKAAQPASGPYMAAASPRAVSDPLDFVWILGWTENTAQVLSMTGLDRVTPADGIDAMMRQEFDADFLEDLLRDDDEPVAKKPASTILETAPEAIPAAVVTPELPVSHIPLAIPAVPEPEQVAAKLEEIPETLMDAEVQARAVETSGVVAATPMPEIAELERAVVREPEAVAQVAPVAEPAVTAEPEPEAASASAAAAEADPAASHEQAVVAELVAVPKPAATPEPEPAAILEAEAVPEPAAVAAEPEPAAEPEVETQVEPARPEPIRVGTLMTVSVETAAVPRGRLAQGFPPIATSAFRIHAPRLNSLPLRSKIGFGPDPNAVPPAAAPEKAPTAPKEPVAAIEVVKQGAAKPVDPPKRIETQKENEKKYADKKDAERKQTEKRETENKEPEKKEAAKPAGKDGNGAGQKLQQVPEPVPSPVEEQAGGKQVVKPSRPARGNGNAGTSDGPKEPTPMEVRDPGQRDRVVRPMSPRPATIAARSDRGNALPAEREPETSRPPAAQPGKPKLMPIRKQESPAAAPPSAQPEAALVAAPSIATQFSAPNIGMPDESGGFLSKIPMWGKIGGAAVLALIIGFVIFSGKSDSNSGGGMAPAADSTILTGTGWIPNWATEGKGATSKTIMIYRPSTAVSDYKFEFSASIEQKGLGWVFRAANPKNYYAMRLEVMKPGLERVLGLVKYAVVDGQPVNVVKMKLPGTYRSDTMYRIATSVSGSKFTTYLQDQLIDVTTDDQIKTGGVGLLSQSGENIQLKSVNFSALR